MNKKHHQVKIFLLGLFTPEKPPASRRGLAPRLFNITHNGTSMQVRCGVKTPVKGGVNTWVDLKYIHLNATHWMLVVNKHGDGDRKSTFSRVVGPLPNGLHGL